MGLQTAHINQHKPTNGEIGLPHGGKSFARTPWSQPAAEDVGAAEQSGDSGAFDFGDVELFDYAQL